MEMYKDIAYEFESLMSDVGVYKNRFRLLRRTPRFSVQIISNKSALMSGQEPVGAYERQLIDAIATLGVLVQEVDNAGTIKPASNWIDNILDQLIILDLYSKVLDYQDSFYVKKAADNVEHKTEPAV